MGFRKVPLAVVRRVNGESREKSRAGARKGWGYWTRAETVGKVGINWKASGRQNVKSAEPVRLGSREMCRGHPVLWPRSQLGI